MDIKPWNEVEISEAEAVLFIYLMFRKDYPEHIAKEFRDAIGGKFSWDNVPGSDSKELLRCLKDYFDIEWTKYVEIIRKINDGKAIQICRGGNSAEIKIDEIKEKATLKISDGRTYNLKVKKENGKLIIIFKEKKWDDRVKLGALKHSNKVSGILKGMARKNLLIKLLGPGVGRPKNNSIKWDMVHNPRRKYYRVNANVLAMTHSVALTEKDINAMRKYIRGSEVYSFDPEDLPIEAQIQYYDPAQIALNRRDEDWSWVNSINVSAALCLLELCAPDELSCIQFINTLKEYDYLTILMTAKTLFQEILDFISPDLHAVSFHDSRYIIPLDLSEEELKERIRKWFNDTCEYIAENKEKRLNNIIGWALRYKKDISLRKHDLNFLRFGNIDKNLRQIIKEFGIAYDKWSMTEYLKDIINHLDDLINRIPYIERGLRSP